MQWPHLELVDGVPHVNCPTRLFDIQVTIVLHTNTQMNIKIASYCTAITDTYGQLHSLLLDI